MTLLIKFMDTEKYQTRISAANSHPVNTNSPRFGQHLYSIMNNLAANEVQVCFNRHVLHRRCFA